MDYNPEYYGAMTQYGGTTNGADLEYRGALVMALDVDDQFQHSNYLTSGLAVLFW